MPVQFPQILVGGGARLILAAGAWAMLGLGAATALQQADEGAPGEAPAAQEAPALTDEARWFASRDSIELRHLIEIAGLVLERPIEFDPKAIQGAARLATGTGYTGSELLATIHLELAQRGLTTVQTPGTRALRVIDAKSAFQMARLEDPTLDAAVAGYLRVLVPLEHARAADLVPTLQALVTRDVGKVQVVPERNALLLGDHRPELEQMLAVVRLLDTGASPPRLFEVELQHGTPLTMKGLVEQIGAAHAKVAGAALKGAFLAPMGARSVLVVAPQEEVDWWRATIERLDRPEAVLTVEYRPRRFGLAESAQLLEQVVRGEGLGESPGTWRLVRDPLTGTLFITTTPTRHREIEQLLARLEATEQGPERPMRTFEVRNRQVKEVLELLRSLLDAGVLDGPQVLAGAPAARGAETVQGATAPIAAPVRASMGTGSGDGHNVLLTADEPTGRILAVGEGRLLDQLALLIETLDVRHPQVLIEAVVVSLTERETRSLGIELQRQFTSGSASVRLASLFGLGSPDPATGALLPAGGAGFSGVVLDPGEFSALVRALETVNQGRSMQRPRMLVNNNHTAQLDAVLEQPYISVNASNTVATTSLGGTLEAGTAIRVQPQVADGDRIVLEYEVSISSFVGEALEPTLPPPRQQNTLASVVTIPDGYTVVVGGLELQSESEATTRTPLLGSLPLVGALFRNRTNESSRSRFFVFLRASALRNESFADLRHATRPAALEAGIDEGWPRLEPRWIR